MGIFMLYLSSHVDRWLGEEEGSHLNIGLLTALFFILNILAATQDIVVDGWALTMLKRCVAVSRQELWGCEMGLKNGMLMVFWF